MSKTPRKMPLPDSAPPLRPQRAFGWESNVWDLFRQGKEQEAFECYVDLSGGDQNYKSFLESLDFYLDNFIKRRKQAGIGAENDEVKNATQDRSKISQKLEELRIANYGKEGRDKLTTSSGLPNYFKNKDQVTFHHPEHDKIEKKRPKK